MIKAKLRNSTKGKTCCEAIYVDRRYYMGNEGPLCMYCVLDRWTMFWKKVSEYHNRMNFKDGMWYNKEDQWK
jgi:hypothetical protein